jgi:hypothetical protein
MGVIAYLPEATGFLMADRFSIEPEPRRVDAARADVESTSLEPTMSSPDSLREDPVEMWSRRIVIASIILACAGWYVFVVRPNDAKTFAVLACVGDRAPTHQVIDECVARVVQP